MAPFTAQHDLDLQHEAVAPQTPWARADHDALTILFVQFAAYAKAERDVEDLPWDPCVAHWFAEADALRQQVLSHAHRLGKETRNLTLRGVAAGIATVIESDCTAPLDRGVMLLAVAAQVTIGREQGLIRSALQICVELKTGERAPTQEAHPAAIAA